MAQFGTEPGMNFGKLIGGGAVAPRTSTRVHKRPPGLRMRWSALRGETPRGVLTQPLYLPALLGDFEVDEEALHTDYDTVAAGQFSVPAAGPPSARSLRTSDLQTLTLDWEAPWILEYTDPDLVKAELYRILRSRKPFRLHAWLGHGGTELRMKATLRRIARTLRPGEKDTRYYDLEIHEWREASMGRKSSETIGRHHGQLPTKHRLKADDTFNSLSKLYYGSFSGARAIMRENGVKDWGVGTEIVKSHRFKVGDFVKIPKVPAEVQRHSTGGAAAPKG